MTRPLAAAALALALMAGPAFAAPSHHAHHRHHHRTHTGKKSAEVITCDRFGCTAGVQRVGSNASVSHAALIFGASSLVSAARASLGETAAQMGVRRSLWCMAALNQWLRRAGYRTSGSDMASSALRLGQRVSRPQIGAIAFMYRRGGGHAGVVTGIDGDGNPIIISGNHGRLVREAVYPRERIATYILPETAGHG